MADLTNTPIIIQIADVGEGHPTDNNFDSPAWKTFIEGDTAEEALAALVGMINYDELDDANNYFRVVNTATNEVL